MQSNFWNVKSSLKIFQYLSLLYFLATDLQVIYCGWILDYGSRFLCWRYIIPVKVIFLRNNIWWENFCFEMVKEENRKMMSLVCLSGLYWDLEKWCGDSIFLVNFGMVETGVRQTCTSYSSVDIIFVWFGIHVYYLENTGQIPPPRLCKINWCRTSYSCWNLSSYLRLVSECTRVRCQENTFLVALWLLLIFR